MGKRSYLTTNEMAGMPDGQDWHGWDPRDKEVLDQLGEITGQEVTGTEQIFRTIAARYNVTSAGMLLRSTMTDEQLVRLEDADEVAYPPGLSAKLRVAAVAASIGRWTTGQQAT